MTDASAAMDSSFTVNNYYDFARLSSNVTIRNVGGDDLSSSVTIRNVGSADLSANFSIGDSVDLSASVTVRNASDDYLSSSATIRNVGSADLSTSVTVRNIGSADLSSSFTIRKSASIDLSASVTIRQPGSADLSSSVFVWQIAGDDLSNSVTVRNIGSVSGCLTSFWVHHRTVEKVERISHNMVVKSWETLTIDLEDDYTTILEADVQGYPDITAAIVAGSVNDLTYRIQGRLSQSPSGMWAGIPSQVDIDVTASDPENPGNAAIFSGSFEKIRIQGKNKTPASDSRAVVQLRATRVG